ncbi:MAG TPA: hypothetical protein VL749_12765 [Patescibacteria group bacterium]|jgi:hypothetical protein|nr:hypothetical protein [Patescibacteria group bacterium]
MSFHGRSLDDQPLAAYSTGVDPDEDEPLDEPAAEPADIPARPLTQQDLAAALADSTAPAAPPVAIRPRRSFRLPSIKLPSIGLGRGKAAALDQAAPFKPVAQAAAAPAGPVSTFQAVATPAAPPAAFQAAATPVAAQAPFRAVSQPAVQPIGKPAKQPKTRSVKVGAPVAPAGIRGRGRVPPTLLRDPRVLAGGVIAIGVALLGFSLLTGGGPGAALGGPNSSQDNTAVLPTAPVLGNATIELTTGTTGTITLTGATGAGPAVDSRIDATWTDPSGQSLGIVGLASQGTRTTDPNFVLTWTMLLDGNLVTFTSRDSECTIGMAVAPKAVHGTIVCKKLRSGDHVIDLRGSYTT